MRMWTRISAVLLGSLLWAGCYAVDDEVVEPAIAKPVVEATPTPERWIKIDKSERVLWLYEGDRMVRQYPVVFGNDPYWPKLHEGDKRTPEGEYHIIKKYPHAYWSKFMLLDYPTPMNHEVYEWSRAHGLLPRTARGGVPGIGGAIGIHGAEDESKNRRGLNWTLGCVSLFNRDVDELYDLVPLGTRVMIQR